MKQIQVYKVIKERSKIPYECTLVPLTGVFVQVSDHRESLVNLYKWWLSKDQVMRRRENYKRVFLVNVIAEAMGLEWDGSKECPCHLDSDYLNLTDENISVMTYEEVQPR